MPATPAPHDTVNAAPSITRATIEAAASRIAPHIIETPLIESPRLNDKLGIRLLVKAECLQHTGSFKLRGASNAVWSLDDKVTDVVAFSSGNHPNVIIGLYEMCLCFGGNIGADLFA